MFLNEEFINLYEELSNLTEAKTGIPYKGYIICYGCHNTDRWYIKDSYENFLGTKSGYSTEKEAQEEIDDMVEVDLCENTRSSAEIQAEIEKLQQELVQAKIAEKKAAYAGNLPDVVYIWDMYMNADEKGTWTSAELRNNKYEGTVFETEKGARDAALNLLSELDDEDELDSDDWNDDYYIDAVEIPLSEVSEQTLRFSNLDHLIS